MLIKPNLINLTTINRITNSFRKRSVNIKMQDKMN
jgi:hypothetical protein